jgi:hypothetical protein
MTRFFPCLSSLLLPSHRLRYEMADYDGFAFLLAGADRVDDSAIGDRETFLLPHILRPGLDYEGLDEAVV